MNNIKKKCLPPRFIDALCNLIATLKDHKNASIHHLDLMKELSRHLHSFATVATDATFFSFNIIIYL